MGEKGKGGGEGDKENAALLCNWICNNWHDNFAALDISSKHKLY